LEDVNTLASQRQYKNRDEVTISPQAMGNIYEDKVKSFFHEHLHEDEEIRYILDGAGFFDVRSEGDDWVRIRLEKNDLMIMPAGIYHRFTTDTQNVSLLLHKTRIGANTLQYTKAMRLFKEDPKWTPLNRGNETDKNQYRQEYLRTLSGTPIASQ
jgi:1,2-dihydroxy-3-keto-5-methylthiopentene dioxygenase